MALELVIILVISTMAPFRIACAYGRGALQIGPALIMAVFGEVSSPLSLHPTKRGLSRNELLLTA